MSIKNEMINVIKHHYEEIPAPILNIIGAVGNQFGYGVRYGKSFSEVYKELQKTEFLSEEELEKIVVSANELTVHSVEKNCNNIVFVAIRMVI